MYDCHVSPSGECSLAMLLAALESTDFLEHTCSLILIRFVCIFNLALVWGAVGCDLDLSLLCVVWSIPYVPSRFLSWDFSCRSCFDMESFLSRM